MGYRRPRNKKFKRIAQVNSGFFYAFVDMDEFDGMSRLERKRTYNDIIRIYMDRVRTDTMQDILSVDEYSDEYDNE